MPSNPDHRPSPFLQYGGLGIQMLAVIMVGVYAGRWLDGQQNNTTPVWTLVLALVGIGASLYLLINGLPKQL
jgi:ATP synthase protein I